MVDEKEFEDLINRYRAEIYRYCLAVSGGDRSVADDAFSDMLKVIFEKWEILDKGDSLRIYLYKTADMCITARKREKKWHNKHFQSLDAALAEGTLTETEYTDNYFTDKTSVEAYISKIESNLDKEELTLFRLRYIKKIPLLKISDITSIPYSSLRYKYFKLEKRIREEIKKLF